MRKKIIIFSDGGILLKRSSGAYRIATLLRQRKYHVIIVDFFEHWSDNELNEVIEKHIDDSTIAFAFSITWMRNSALKNLINLLKEKYPGRKYIAGGNKPIQENFGLDLTVTGYVENALDSILEYLFNNGEKPKGIHPDFAPNTLHINADNEYPAHNQKNLEVVYTPDDKLQPYEQLTLEVSRGCKFKCKYCCYPFLGFKQSTHRDKNNLKQELVRNYNEFGVYNYTLADDTINDDDDKLRMLADVVENLSFEVNFTAFVRMDLTITKPYQIELLSRARIWGHFYGIETFNRTAGLAVGKGMDPERIKDGMLKMREHMLDTLGLYRGSTGLIAGLPTENVESWQNTQKWMECYWNTETWHWWPLDMTTDNTNKSLQSDLSKNADKFGYYKMKDQQRIEKLYTDFSIHNTQETPPEVPVYHHIDNSFFPWQNDYTDFLEASEFCRNTEQKMFGNYNLSNFMILDFYDKTKDKKQLLNIKWKPIVYENTATLMPYNRDKISEYKRLMLCKK